MKFLVTGVNHKTAPVELREQLAIPGERLEQATRSLLAIPGVVEAMVVSTCNRVELVAAYEESVPDMAAFFDAHFAVARAELRPHLYQHQDAEAVRHLFRVAASLDSMVVGEPQILGQVKASYTVARGVGAVGTQLEQLLQSAFSAAKKVRAETRIGSSSVSIASVAVDLARKIFGSLEGRRVLLVGAGKMGELAARHLLGQGAGSILVTNRTEERAVSLARAFGGRVLPFAELKTRAGEADIVITSTGASGFLFAREDGQMLLQRRRGRPMFFIDIAVPRDVDPEMNRVEGVFLYDIDDLQSVSTSNMANRGREATSAERIIGEEVERFVRRSLSLDVVPALLSLQQNVESMRQAELHRAQNRLQGMTPEQVAAVEALTRGLASKFLHLPLRALRQAARQGDAARVEILRETFQLEQGSAASVDEVSPAAEDTAAVEAEETEPVSSGKPA
ncbi:MAG TPA: glutamyl-tRNA reductase [Acidobacteriaceae bacterium]